jgi:hypothetical protein
MKDETLADPLPHPPLGAATDADALELSEEDEALLRDFGQWLHAKEAEETMPPEIDLFIAPPPPPPIEAQIEARVATVLRRPRRKPWTMVLSHGAVAAATVALAWAWSSSSDEPDPRPEASYTLTLSGGEGKSFGTPDGPTTYPPASTFGFTLRSSRPVVEPTEVVVKAHRTNEHQDIWIQLRPEQLEHDENTLRYKALAHSALPLAAGDWELTFEVGAPNACISSAPERSCELAGRARIVIPRESDAHAP